MWIGIRINSENINKFIESLSSLNNTFDIDGKISKINVLKPDIVIIFLQDILARIIELIFNIDNLSLIICLLNTI